MRRFSQLPLAARVALTVAFNALVALVLAYAPLPTPVRIPLGLYLVSVSTGAVVCQLASIRISSLPGVIALVATSWLGLFLATILPFTFGVRYGPRRAALELLVLQAVLLAALLLPGVRRRAATAAASCAKARRPRSSGPRRYLAPAGAILATAAIVTTLILVGRTQAEQVGNAYSVLALDDALARTATINASAGQQVSVPVHMTTTGTRAPSAGTVTLNGQAAGTVALQEQGDEWDGTAVVTAPTTAGRYRLEVRVPNPTYIDAPTPTNPAMDTGSQGEAQGSAQTLTVDVWVVVA